MKPLRLIPIVFTAALLGSAASLGAQQPTPAPSSPPASDTAQGYAPGAAPAPVAAPAPTPTTAPAPQPRPPLNPRRPRLQPRHRRRRLRRPLRPLRLPALLPLPLQQRPRLPTPQTVAQALGFVDVIPAREPERIQRQIDLVKNNGREADAAMQTASENRSKTKAMIDVKKQEISTIDARIKLADKSKNDTEKITLNAEKKVNETQKAFLERRRGAARVGNRRGQSRQATGQRDHKGARARDSARAAPADSATGSGGRPHSGSEGRRSHS